MLNDPIQAMAESKKLIESAEACQGIINNMNQIIEDIPSFWEGVSANIFIRNNHSVVEHLDRARKEMLQISDEIKVLAEAI